MEEFTSKSLGGYPEIDFEDPDQPPKGGIRIRAVILLLVFLLPTILFAIEVITGSVSGFWAGTIKPVFPEVPELLNF
jgi:hypothetical protein